MKTIRVRLNFLTPMLGTKSADEKIYEKFIHSQAPDAATLEEEIEAIGVENVVENGMTVFARDNETGKPMLWNYQIKGFFKAACSALRKAKGTKSSKMTAFKKNIDLRIFVYQDAEKLSDRKIIINTEEPITSLQRPLRSATPKGEIVALANSECIAAGATCEFDIVLLNEDDKEIVMEWLDYGKFHGIGQWRNAGYGSFDYTVL